MALQRKISRARNRQLIGREFPVLVEGPSKETDLLWEARLATQAPEIDGVCLINDFRAGRAAPGRNAAPAHYRSARLRPGRRIGGCSEPGSRKHAESQNPFVILPQASIPKSYPEAALSRTQVCDRISARMENMPSESKKTIRCPICKKEVAFDDPEHAFLQRPLPHHRSGQLGYGEIRDSGSRAPEAEDIDDRVQRKRMNRIAIALATCFGCGFFPIGPGTVGSLAGIATAALFHWWGAGRFALLVRCDRGVSGAVWAVERNGAALRRKDPGRLWSTKCWANG